MKKIVRACSYAAQMHAGQRRKGAAGEPYVNHVIDVADRVAQSAAADETLVIAALLHDVVEDTRGTAAEIAAMFGADVAALVLEVSDNKALPKAERKWQQEMTVAAKSDGAKRIKLADKASNLTALALSPPTHWDAARKADYVAWAMRVIEPCRGLDPLLEAGFDAAVLRAQAALGLQA